MKVTALVSALFGLASASLGQALSHQGQQLSASRTIGSNSTSYGGGNKKAKSSFKQNKRRGL